MLSISEVEHIDLTAAAADGSQIADLLSSYDKANAETQTAAIKVEHEAEAASSKEEDRRRRRRRRTSLHLPGVRGDTSCPSSNLEKVRPDPRSKEGFFPLFEYLKTKPKV